MVTYGITSTGFNKKTATTIQTELENDLKGIFGDNIKLGADAAFGQWARTLSERFALVWDLAEAVYHSQYRDTASGQSLDATVGLIGKSRIEASYSTVTLTLASIYTGGSIVVPTGTKAKQSTLEVEWETTAEATIPAAVDVLEDLDIDTTTWQSGNTVRVAFNGTPDLSSVVAGDMLYISGSTNSQNDGLFAITNVNDGSDYVDITNLKITDGTYDEATDATGTGVITDGYITVAARSAEEGAFEASGHSIDTIVTPITNWDYVSNQEVGVTGTDEETDAELRIRTAASTVVARGSTADAIVEQILTVDNVTYAQIEQNRTNATVNGLLPHSILLTVVGGTDQDIVDKLGEVMAVGINTNGSESATYTDPQGVQETFYFNRVTEVSIYLDVTVTTDSNYPATGDADIKQALDDYFDTLEHGDDVLNHRLVAIVSDIPGVLTITILQSKTDPPGASTNITIDADEIAVVSQADIDVTS